MPNSDETHLSRLLVSKNVERWYKNNCRGAQVTADVYVRRLASFCRWAQMTPDEFARLPQESVYEVVLDYVTHEQERGMKGSYIHSSLKAIKSWLQHNGQTIPRKIKIKDAYKTPTLDNERVPTQDELRRIFLNANLKNRVACVLMAHAGLRPEVIGNYLGTDGLRVRDLPGMKVMNGKVSFDNIPTMVMVRSELSKTSNKYFTFIGDEGCDYLRDYLESRIASGESIDPDTDIIHPRNTPKKFSRSINISDGIRKSIQSAGYKWRPYVLRAYCDTQLLLAESKGKITHPYRQFFMGHLGDIEARYSVNKGILPDELIEDMREAYRRSLPFLQTIPTEDEDKKVIEFRKHILRVSGVSQNEIDKMDIEEMDDKDVMEYLRKKLINTMTENGHRQKVIPENQVEEFLDRGWEYIGKLSEDRAIVKLPFT